MTALPWIERGLRTAIAQHGRSVTIKRVIPGGLNTATGIRASTDNSFSCTAARDPAVVSSGGASDVQEYEYTLVRSDVGFTPDANDTLTDDGRVAAIISVAPSADSLALKVRVQFKK